MKIKSIISLTLALFLLIFADSCKVKNPLEGAKLIINYDILKTYINVQFEDAATGNLIGFEGNDQVRVTIYGEDADAVSLTAPVPAKKALRPALTAILNALAI